MRCWRPMACECSRGHREVSPTVPTEEERLMLNVDMCVAHFAWWLGTRPERERYLYDNTDKCATAQYLTAHGFRRVHAGHTTSTGYRKDGVWVSMIIPFEVRQALMMNAGPGGYTRWGDAAKAMQRVLAQM